MERPTKRARLGSISSSSEASENNSDLANGILSINKEFARKFEHNKQREERQQLEEKFNAASDESSNDETEDDDADLITPDLDQEILTTLNAIKSKDPRVYDQSTTFYRSFDDDDPDASPMKPKKESPMTLKDYHRENLLAGFTGAQSHEPPQTLAHTYQEEQDELRQNVVGQLHAIAEDDNGDDVGFLVKSKGRHQNIPAPTRPRLTTDDVAAADKDPETFLSNLMAAQAWRPVAGQMAVPFDSDDSEEDARAEAFEEAYNMRFEDPAKANEKLRSFARDLGQYSVRHEKQGTRKRAREREQKEKEEARRERARDRERLRKLKVDEAEEKLRAIKHAAGLAGKDVDVDDWREMLEGDFDDDAWDKEMHNRFGEHYYAAADEAPSVNGHKEKKHRPRKPTWEDDIDVGDIVADLGEVTAGGFTLTDEEEDDSRSIESPAEQNNAKENHERKARNQHKRDRRMIEQMVESSLPVTATAQGAFRYRDTSPVSFGMRAQDILFATDAQLNEFAGLKKLAPFRDEGRKAKDRKRLGKKGRLREWRREVFGNDKPPLASLTVTNAADSSRVVVGDVSNGGKKKTDVRRTKKRKSRNKSAT